MTLLAAIRDALAELVELQRDAAASRRREALHQARLTVSGDALLTLPEAARLLGTRDARRWLEEQVPARWVAGQRRVLWRDVVDAAREREERQAPARRRSALRIAEY